MNNGIPKGWNEVELGNVLKLINGFAFKPSQWNGRGLPIIRIQNLNNPTAPFNYSDEKLPEKIRVRNGDLLFAWSGTPGTSFGAHIWNGGDAWLNQHIFRVHFEESQFDKCFLRHAINQNLDRYIAQAHGGAGLAHITKGMFEQSYLQVAPLEEQRRIVAKLEPILEKVDGSKKRLKRIPVLLKRFRQSVLAAACSGRLTEDWRGENAHITCEKRVIETILQKRNILWLERSNGKVSGRKSSYKEPVGPDTALIDIPSTWKAVSVAQIALLDVGFAFKSAEYSEKGVKLLRGENLEPGSLRWEDTRYWPEQKLNGLEHLLIENGEIILALDRPLISSGLKIARAKQSDLPCLLVQRMMRFKVAEPQMTSWLFYNLSVPYFVQHLTSGLTGSDLPHVTGTGVSEYTFGLPPVEEQIAIVKRVEELFKLADEIQTRYEKGKKFVDKLTQSILAKAFRGELVPQDPNDEPGEQILECIRRS